MMTHWDLEKVIKALESIAGSLKESARHVVPYKLLDEAIDIVEELAASEVNGYKVNNVYCAFCGAQYSESHASDCLHYRAREWKRKNKKKP